MWLSLRVGDELIQNKIGGGEVADFKYHVFDPSASFTIQGLEFTPLAGKAKRKDDEQWILTGFLVHHGKYMTTNAPYLCYGFYFDGVSYISDTNYIPPETMAIMKGQSRIFVVDCLRCKVNLFFLIFDIVLTNFKSDTTTCISFLIGSIQRSC